MLDYSGDRNRQYNDDQLTMPGVVRQVSENTGWEQDHDAQPVVLLWAHFGLQRHLRSETAWRFAWVFWDNIIGTDDTVLCRLRLTQLGEALWLYNSFFRTETFVDVDPAVLRQIEDMSDADICLAATEGEGVAELLPFDSRWIDDPSVDDDDWSLYDDVSATLGLIKRIDWPTLDHMLRKMLVIRTDCYNGGCRARLLLDIVWRAQHSDRIGHQFPRAAQIVVHP
jgi:hypothetical protein